MSRIKELFMSAVDGLLHDGEYFNLKGEPIKGNALSFVAANMRGIGWEGFSGTVNAENTLQSMGYKVVEGKNYRGQRCLVVTPS